MPEVKIDSPASFNPKESRQAVRKEMRVLRKQIVAEKRQEDLEHVKAFKYPVHYESMRAINRIIDTLPDGVSQRFLEAIKRPMGPMTKVVDTILYGGDRILTSILFWKVFRLSALFFGKPEYAAIQIRRSARVRGFIAQQADKFTFVTGLQLDRPDLLPKYIGYKILYSLRRIPVRAAADRTEAFVRSEKGKKWLARMEEKHGERMEKIIERISTGWFWRKQSGIALEQAKSLGDHQVLEAVAKA